jgi:putative tryptophan/tyrosine transport system substrate-binding protein
MRLRAIGLIAIVALTLSLLAAPLIVTAQPRSTVPRIGILTPAADASSPLWEAFRHGLRDLGYVEGQNIVLEYRFAAGQNARLPALAAELVQLQVDVMVTNSGPGAQAAKDATAMIPIVTATSGHYVVTSLARPDGNITGLTLMTPEVGGKRLELLKEALPHVSRVAVLQNLGNPVSADELREIETAAHGVGLQLQSFAVRHPDELDSVFAAMTREGAEALIALADAVFWNHRSRVVALATQHRLPAVFDAREFAEAGGLMTYGPHVPDSYRRAAVYVDKILKGAKPADLPVERPVKFELVINLKTAKALGVTIPQTLLFQADEVIR